MFATLVAVTTITTFVSSFASFRQHRVAQRANERVDTLMGSLIGSDDLHRMHRIDRRLRIATGHAAGRWRETVRDYIEESVAEEVDPSLSAEAARVCAVAFNEADHDDLAQRTLSIVALLTLATTVAGLVDIAGSDDWAPVATIVALQLLILYLLWFDVSAIRGEIEQSRRDLTIDGTPVDGIIPVTCTPLTSSTVTPPAGATAGSGPQRRLPLRLLTRFGAGRTDAPPWYEESRANRLLPLWAYPSWRRAFEARTAAYECDGGDGQRLALQLAETAVRYAPLDPEARRLHAAIHLDGLTDRALEMAPTEVSSYDQEELKELIDQVEAALRQARAANILRLREQYQESGELPEELRSDEDDPDHRPPPGAPVMRAVVGMQLRARRPFDREMGRAEVLVGLLTQRADIRERNLSSGWRLLTSADQPERGGDDAQPSDDELREYLGKLQPGGGVAAARPARRN